MEIAIKSSIRSRAGPCDHTAASKSDGICHEVYTGFLFLIYWVGCFVFTIAAIIIALLDVRAVRRRTQAERRELLERSFQDIEKKKPDPPKPTQPENFQAKL